MAIASRFRNCVFLLGLLALALACDAEPRETAATGSLAGRLTDWHSLPLEQADVVVRNMSTGAEVRGTTGKNGSYRFAGLGPGEYRIEADVPRLGKGAVEGIVVSAGHATRVQAALVLEWPTPPLPAETGLHDLDPVAAAVTTVLDSEELRAVPVATRSWEEFVAGTPGANPVGQGGDGRNDGQLGDQTGAAEAGSGEGLELGAVDAIEDSTGVDGVVSTQGFHAESGGSGRLVSNVGESAVVELQARSGDAPVDVGRAPGGLVSLMTGRGRHGLHGQILYQNRQNSWSAKNPFTQWVQETAPASGIDIAQFTAEPYSAPRSREGFGFGIGSQIKRDKIFWFAALDASVRNDPAVATVRHPDLFFARPSDDELTVLAARLALPGPAVLEESASAYSTGLEGLAGLLGPAPRSAKQGQGFARIDWQVTERNHLVLEGNGTNLDAPGSGNNRSVAELGTRSFGNTEASEYWGLGRWETFLTPNLLNAAAAMYRRHTQSDLPQTPSAFEAPLMTSASGQLPEIVTDSTNGFILGKPAQLGSGRQPDERSFLAQDTLSWVPGKHLLKFGGSFDHIADSVGTLVNQTGTYSYADVLNFVSDYSSFTKYGLSGIGDPFAGQHNCDARGRVYRLGDGTLGGLGYLPCYAWYSQRVGPSNWNLSTNDMAGFATEQWQPFHNLTLSAGVRVDAEQLPAPIAAVANPDLPATQKLPETTLNWGPRFGLAYAPLHGTVLRLGAGMYFGRIDNSTVLAALTQTGSPSGDLNLFFKPTDVGAPPFPYVFPESPQTVVTPGAVAFAPRFRPQEVDQAVASLEQELPSHWLVSVSGLASLGRRLPISVDTNLEQATDPFTKGPQTLTYDVVDASGVGPLKAGSQVTVPFYTERPDASYQQLTSIESRANSTYEAALVKLTRYGGHGLSLRAHYLYAHAMDWNPNESAQVAGNDVLDPGDFGLEYGASNMDIRHSAAAVIRYQTPWKLRGWEGAVTNAWSVSGVGQFRSGLPFTMRTSGYIPAYYNSEKALVEGVGPGMNGSAGDNRLYGVGRNTYRYPSTYTGDMRLGKVFDLRNHRELELLAESFNLFNHQNVTLIETTGYVIHRGTTSEGPPTLNFLTGLTNAGLPGALPEFGKPLDVNATNFYRQREIQLGLRARF